MSEHTIGDTVYKFDINRRVYRQQDGRSVGGPIYREHFASYVIVGEEKRSWLLAASKANNAHPTKVSKFDFRLYTADEVEAECWVNEHRHRVANMVNNCTNTETLKAVAALVGYMPEPNT